MVKGKKTHKTWFPYHYKEAEFMWKIISFVIFTDFVEEKNCKHQLQEYVTMSQRRGQCTANGDLNKHFFGLVNFAFFTVYHD